MYNTIMKWSCRKYCKKFKDCANVCEVIDTIAGKGKNIQELLPPPDIASINNLDHSKHPPVSKGYKEVLQANIEARRDYIPTTIKEIRSLNDIRLRAIAAMAYSNISIQDIAHLLNYSTNHVYKIVNQK